MKILATVFGAATLFAAQSSYACVPFNTASFEAALITQALGSKAFKEKVYQLGSGYEAKIVAVKKDANAVTVSLSDKCAIVIEATAREPKDGERACMNFDYSAQTLCQ